MRTITNECGIFYVSDTGVLEKFECVPKNSMIPGNSTPECASLWDLHIPEGVRVLPENAFRGYGVRHELTFPDSLQVLGEGKGGAFSHCELGEVTLPKRAKIGPNTFSSSHIIDTVKIPDGADHQTTVKLAHALRFTFSWHDLGEHWPQEYADIYCGKSEPKENWKRLTNGSGTFFIDSDGVLMDFDCHLENGGRQELFRLNIPEGVTAIPGDMFVNCRVLWEMTLPESLKCIGCGAGGINTFACSLLPDVVLPENLELFGRFAFGASYIRSLTFPRNLKDSLYAVSVREFKDSYIMELQVPAECRKHLNGNITGWGWPKIEISELTDPKLGAMCCLKAADGMIMGEGIVPQVINALRLGEEEIN